MSNRTSQLFSRTSQLVKKSSRTSQLPETDQLSKTTTVICFFVACCLAMAAAAVSLEIEQQEQEYDMTTIRRQHREARKWPWIVLVVVMLGIAGVLVFKPHYDKQNQIRGDPPPEEDSTADKQQKESTNKGTDKTNKTSNSSGGREITFEVTFLDGEEGATDKFVVQSHPDWAPKGVEQFHKLIDAGFYNQCRFFRVVPNFVVQFGINGDPAVQKQYKTPIQDDPVKHTNARGTVTFATSGPNTRTTQLFINTNTNGNAFLDRQGFSPFGEVTTGMEVVDRIYKGYKEKPQQGRIQAQGNEYLEKEFPKLTYITVAA